MRVSIRIKLVGLLAAVALLPLLVALVTIVVGGSRLRRESFGKGILALTSSQAEILSMSLTKDIESLHMILEHDPEVVKFLAAKEMLPPDEIARLDAQWPTLSTTHGPLGEAVINTTADKLRLQMAHDPRISEILLTDRFGQLAATTGRTTDFFQADEAWWLGAYHKGKGRIFIPPVGYDASSKVWSIEICMPVRREDEVVGIAKSVLNISLWAAEVTRAALKESAEARIVRPDGLVVYHADVRPGETRLEDWSEDPAAEGDRGWHVTEKGTLLSYARIKLPARIEPYDVTMPHWTLVLSTPEAQVLKAVHRLTLIVVFVGMAIIVGVFTVGLYLVDRSIGRRIRQLRRATGMVAKGDFTQRIPSGWGGIRLLGTDEISDLAADFNRMIEAVQRSHEALRSTNEMKTNFIRIASHELRTPVSYMLGMSRLLAGGADPDRLRRVLQTMGGKAKRLEEIIRAMFKLMPNQQYAEDVKYGRVHMPELVEEIHLDCQPFLEMRDQQLAIDVIENVPVIQADRDKLRDIIENLVMNAIKFSPDGGTVRLDVAEELGGYLRISVADKGPGISQSDLPNIFEPFFSTSDVMKHSSGEAGYQKRGMGLGLAVVKHFVELHGGSVRVETGAKGTVFRVLIPVEPGLREARPAQPKP